MFINRHILHQTIQALSLVASVCLSTPLLAAQPSNALPTGGQVAAGQAAISQSGNTMTVTQSSQRAVVNWDSYNVGSQATVNYQQPNSQAVILNRVISASPSLIDGAINANGKVIISNANGVTFGKGAEVNAAAVVATTMNQSDAEFMAGSNTFTGKGKGKVVNKGRINVTDVNGYVALLAPEVRNQGVILATVSASNAVVAGAGEKVTLNFKGNSLIGVTVDKAAVDALIVNKHAIEVAGGVIALAAGSADQLMRSVVKNTGRISASSIAASGGHVELVAATVQNKGTIVANADGPVGNGGSIKLVGNNVELSSKSDIQANAKTHGNGGDIKIWANEQASVAGQLSATGGAVSGNGGSIGTSAKLTVKLDPALKVDTSAKNGRYGQWTIDPLELTVDATAANLISNALRTTNVVLDATGSACIGSLANCTSSQTPLVNFLAGASIYSSNASTVLRVLAAGGTVNVDNHIEVGQVYMEAATINVRGNIGTTGGASSNIVLLGAQINILGGLGSNGQTSSGTSSASNIGSNRRRRGVDSGLASDDALYTSAGGNILVVSSGDIFIGSQATLTANGQSGGKITIVSQAGTVTQQGVVDAVGAQEQGGQITIAGQTATMIVGALMSVDGAAQGGLLQIGVAQNMGSGTTLAPPAIGPPVSYFNNQTFTTTSRVTLLDQQTGLSANSSFGPGGTLLVSATDSTTLLGATLVANGLSQGGTVKIGNDASGGRLPFSANTFIDAASRISAAQQDPMASSTMGGLIETSGHTLHMLGSINAGRGGMWLLDPYDVTIGSGGTSCASGSACTFDPGSDSTVDAASIAATLTAGNSVTINTGTSGSSAGNIYVQSPITVNTSCSSNCPYLALQAAGSIVVTADITVPGALYLGGTAIQSGYNDVNTGLASYLTNTSPSPSASLFATATNTSGATRIAGVNIGGAGCASGVAGCGSQTARVNVSISAKADIYIVGSSASISGAKGIVLTSGSQVTSTRGNVYFYGYSSSSNGMQISWGGQETAQINATGGETATTLWGFSTTNTDAGVFINGAYLSSPSIRIYGSGGQASNCSASGCAVSIGSSAGSINLLQTDNLSIFADAISFGQGGSYISSISTNNNYLANVGSPYPVTVQAWNTAYTSGSSTAVATRLSLSTYTDNANGLKIYAQTYSSGVTPAPGAAQTTSTVYQGVADASPWVSYSSTSPLSNVGLLFLGQLSGLTLGSPGNLTNTPISFAPITVKGDIALYGKTIDLGGYSITAQVSNSTITMNGVVSNTSGATISTANGVTGASLVLENTSATSNDIAATIAGELSVVLNAGKVTLSGESTYSGGTFINSGILQLGGDFHATQFALGPNNSVVPGVILDSPVGLGNLTINAGGTLDLNGHYFGSAFMSNQPTITMAGTTDVNQASLVNSSATSVAVFSPITLTNTSTANELANVIAQAAGGSSQINASISDGTGTNYSGLQVGTSSYLGTVKLSGANTYSGGTTVAYGTLQIGHATALGTGNALVELGAVLDLNGFTLSTENALTLNGTGISNGGALTNSSASAVTYAGAITLGTAPSVGGNNGAITLSGDISGTTGLTKVGSDTVLLSGNNSYSGGTTVSAGILQVGSATALGVGSSAVSVTSGAVLDLNGTTMTNANALTLNGTGISSSGVLMNSSTTAASYAGLVTLGSATLIKGDAGTIALTHTGTITGATLGLTLGGAQGGSIASIIGTTTGTLTKQDAGTWTLSGTNTYTGLTSISGGILAISNDRNLGAVPSSIMSNSITLSGGTLQAIAVPGQSVANTVTLNGYRGIALAAGSVLAATTGNVLDVGGIIAGGYSLSINGASQGGSVVLSGANTYSGGTTVNAGVLKFGSAYMLNATKVLISSPIGMGNLVINAGGTVDLNGNNFGGTGQTGILPTITMSGSDVNNQAFLINSSSTALTVWGQITLTKIAGAAGTLVDVIATSGGAITLGNSSAITDPASIVDGSAGTNFAGLQIGTSLYGGTVVANGLNTYQGGTTINNGTLQFKQRAYFKCGTNICSSATGFVAGPVGIGVITINGGGTLDVNGSGNSSSSGLFLNAIIMAGTSGSSQASLLSSIAVAQGGANWSTVSGNITLANVSGSVPPGTLVNVIAFPPSSPGWNFIIAGVISDGVGSNYAGLQIGRAGDAGVIQLTGNNTYSGGTAVNGGGYSLVRLMSQQQAL